MKYVVIIFLCFLYGCAALIESIKGQFYGYVEVPIKKYNRVAVLEFKSPEESPRAGGIMSDLISAEFKTKKIYKVIAGSEIKALLVKEDLENLQRGYKDAIVKSGAVLKVDAFIIGDVKAYKVDEHKAQDVTMKAGKIITEVKKIIKEAKVSVETSMYDAKDGHLVKTKASFKDGIYIATTPVEIQRLPTNESILNELSKKAIKDIVNALSPEMIAEKRRLAMGKDKLTKHGVKCAKRDLWEEAFSAWQKAINENPKNAYAYNNIGVYYENVGNLSLAIEHYKKALEILPDEDTFFKNLSEAKKTTK